MHRPLATPTSAQTQPRALNDWLWPSLLPKGDERLAVGARPGRDFAMQDYLALAAHPALRSAAQAALGQHLLVMPDLAVTQDRPAPIRMLQDRMARFVHLEKVHAFSSGTEAIRATLSALLRPHDRVIVDAGAHPAMFETVLAARAHLHRTPPGSFEGVERRLRRLSRLPRRGRLVVAVPAVGAFTSVTADLADLAALCTTHNALLVVDTSHDLGAMAQDGGGVMELQGCLGRIDIVLGSFAKSFGAPGGYAAFRDPALADRVCSLRRAVPLSPVLAAAILAALGLIDSPEGRRRRRRLHGNALRLRNHLMADGLRVLGQPSPLVPVPLPALTAQSRAALLHSAGPNVPLIMAPHVAGHAPRWRILLSSDHSPADIDNLADLIRDVTRACDRQHHHARLPQQAIG